MPVKFVTPLDVALQEQAKCRSSFAIETRDGVVTKVVKWVFGLKFWYVPIEWLIRLTLRRMAKGKEATDIQSARHIFRQAVDVVWIVVTVFFIACYVVAACFAAKGEFIEPLSRWENFRWWLLLTIVALSVYRLFDIVSVILRLAVFEREKRGPVEHTLFLTGLAYIQVSLCFAILYLADASMLNDAYRESAASVSDDGRLVAQPVVPLWANGFDAFYFSSVTISTLGYGDLSPQGWTGKLGIVFEVWLGLVLILVAFQQALAGPSDTPRNAENDLISNLISQWDSLPWSEKLTILEENVPCGEFGSLRLLAKEEQSVAPAKKKFVAIQFADDRSAALVVGQLSGFMGWILQNRADTDVEGVRGIIVSRSVTDELQTAAKPVGCIKIYRYSEKAQLTLITM